MAQPASDDLEGGGSTSMPPSPIPTSDNRSSPSASPSTSFSSDKENRSAHPMSSSRAGKRKTNALSISSPNTHPAMADATNKRRRVSERALSDQGMSLAHQRRLHDANDTDFYDPDQNPAERRAVRKGLRDLATNLNDSRSEFLQPESRGIHETLEKANEYFKSVKQTSDATIDSRLLVAVAELSYKRTAQAVLGDSAAGIDVDEFVSKCISFMRRQGGDAPSLSNTQPRSRRVTGRQTQAAEDSEDEDDPFNWDCLGRRACFPNNLRPSLSGFLLGPLSVQKRVRQQTQRRARQERIDPSQLVRPQDLKAEDLGKKETETLTTLCTNIRSILVKTQKNSENLVNEELSQLNEVSDDHAIEVMNKYGIADDGGVPLFRFCINPNSFGQTVENMFYLSFLVRDGSVGVAMDGHDLPTLHPSEPALPSQARQQGLEKHQAVFSLDFDMWEKLIETFDIKNSLIPHREEHEEQGNGSTATTWQA